MAYRTFVQLTHAVLREVNTPLQRATLYDVQEALNDAYKEIIQFHDWNFLLDRYDIPVQTAYTTGTVTATVGSTSVTGVGTAWNVSWTNKKILLTGDSEEKEIVSFGGVGSLTLRYPYNSTAPNITGVGYMIFQDSYPIPCSPGRDLSVVNPVFQWSPVWKYDRVRFDIISAFNRYQTGIRPMIYTDDGVDISGSSTNGQAKIQFWPRTISAQDLILRFFKQFTPLLNDTDTTILPAEFEEVLIRVAKSRLRRRYGVPNWTEDHTLAMQTLLQLREVASKQTAYDFTPRGISGDFNDPYATDMAMGVWLGHLSGYSHSFP